MSNTVNLHTTRLLLFLSLTILFTEPATASDVHIHEAYSGKAISETKLIHNLEKVDVVILGEVHDDSICHREQAEIISALINRRRAPALYFEMLTDREEVAHDIFVRAWTVIQNDSSIIKNAARQDVLMWESRGWPAWNSYADIFQLAERNELPVRHADLPPELIRDIRRFGFLAIPKQLRLRLFEKIEEGELNDIFDRVARSIIDAHQIESKSVSLLSGLVHVQMSRDAYMALRLSQAERPTILIAGVEHARMDQGVPFYLKRMAPHLSIVAIGLCGALPRDQGPLFGAPLPFDYIGMPTVE